MWCPVKPIRRRCRARKLTTLGAWTSRAMVGVGPRRCTRSVLRRVRAGGRLRPSRSSSTTTTSPANQSAMLPSARRRPRSRGRAAAYTFARRGGRRNVSCRDKYEPGGSYSLGRNVLFGITLNGGRAVITRHFHQAVRGDSRLPPASEPAALPSSRLAWKSVISGRARSSLRIHCGAGRDR